MSKWRVHLVAILCACAGAPILFGGIETQHSSPDTPAMPLTSCLYDLDQGVVPNCIQRAPNGELFVTKQVLKELRFDSHGLAVLKSATSGWLYVSRTGRVVIRGVPTMDNWADTFHDGLVRIT